MKNFRCKILLITLLAVFSENIVLSQTSPFSVYGIGELYNNGFGRNFAMGGSGIGVRSKLYLNNMNPASYTAMDSLSFFFETGLKGKFQTLNLNDNSTYHSRIDIGYLAFGFPIAKFMFTSIGLRPATNTDYHFQGTIGESIYNYVGKGTISNLYGGLGFKLSRSLSLGAHFNYLFGDSKTFYTQQFEGGIDLLSGAKTETRINDLFLDFGVQYVFDINKDKLIIGGTFSPKTNIRGNSSWVFGTGGSLDNDGFVEITNILNKKDTTDKKIIQMPVGFGFGVSYIINERFTLVADYASKRWGEVDFFGINSAINDDYESANANYYSAGMEWIPNEVTGINYFERVRYRLGVHYADDYIKHNNKQVKDIGICIGMGFPLRRTSTSLNFSVDLGTKGISDKTVSRENYGKVTLSFTMHEYWFMKNKIR